MFSKKINKKIDNINEKLDKSRILEISYIMGSKKEIIKRNLLAGLSRGVGIGIGITLISALIVYLLQKIIKLNIPVVGEYIADIVAIVQWNL
jgi:hypothetical protein